MHQVKVGQHWRSSAGNVWLVRWVEGQYVGVELVENGRPVGQRGVYRWRIESLTGDGVLV